MEVVTASSSSGAVEVAIDSDSKKSRKRSSSTEQTQDPHQYPPADGASAALNVLSKKNKKQKS